jgi:hypothetical protein
MAGKVSGADWGRFRIFPEKILELDPSAHIMLELEGSGF